MGVVDRVRFQLIWRLVPDFCFEGLLRVAA